MQTASCQMRAIVTAITVNILFGGSSCLRIVGITVPELADLHHHVNLFCSYDTGQESLLSVKWYKNDREFFRFTPSHKPRIITFPTTGFLVEDGEDAECGRTKCKITLSHLNLDATGTYTCEISSEGPTFRTDSDFRNMTVAALPQGVPYIRGLRSFYSLGDRLDVTCTSSPSFPSAHMVMVINSKDVDEKYITRIVEPSADGMFISSARLQMGLSKAHFQVTSGGGGLGGATLRLRCSSVVSGVTSRALTAEASSVLVHPQPLHNQMLEWPSSAGMRSPSVTGVVRILSVIVFIVQTNNLLKCN